MFKNNIALLVKNLRNDTNVSQEDLANYIGISRLTYISAENGKRGFKKEEVEKIADFFEKPISDFFEEKINDKNRKLKDLILYIAKNYKSKENLGKTMLNKLLYFSDFNYYEWTGDFISGSTYKKLPYGPVPENITDVLNEMIRDGEIAIKEEKIHDFSTQRIIAIKDIDTNTFDLVDEFNHQVRENYTPYEDLPNSKKIVDDVLTRYENWTARSLSDLSHEDTPYKVVKNYGDIINPTHVFYRSKAFIVNHHNLENEI
ncbi:MAG: DUF4065 domain-containing protein [Candidatus Gracilibacteria bacterium]|nr:DUF4065 domain-containing protein [Candidatus Gracilibacteria bacterium]